MKTLINQRKTLTYTALTAAALLGLGAIQAQAQSVTFNFSDGTSDGFDAGGFGAGAPLAVQNISGVNYIVVPTGGFQVANEASGNAGITPALNTAFNAAMNAALLNPSGYQFSYTWSVNTGEAGWQTGNAGAAATFAQLGLYVNTGGGYYSQDYGGNDANEVNLSGAQIATAQTFTGTITLPFTVFGAADANAATETFWRLGLIVNDNGTGDAELTSISITPTATPEPASLALAGLGGLSMLFLRRRKA
jgi:hypothetical protein